MLLLPRVETSGFLVSHAVRTKLTEVINEIFQAQQLKQLERS